jgi:hypothetical protein
MSKLTNVLGRFQNFLWVRLRFISILMHTPFYQQFMLIIRVNSMLILIRNSIKISGVLEDRFIYIIII